MNLGEIAFDVLKERVITAAVLIPPLILLLYVGGVPLLILCLLGYVRITYEYFCLTACFSRPRVYQLCAVSFLLPLGYLCYSWPGLIAGFALAVQAMFIVSLLEIEAADHEPDYADMVAAAMLGLCYPGLLGSLMVVVAHQPEGNLYFAWLFLVVICTDTLAYFGGRLIGGVSLSPRISPNKTVSGAVSGLLGACGGAAAAKYILTMNAPLASLVGFGLLAGVLAEFGDLSESLVKRMYGVKDSGVLLPGHGGLLDRVDGLLFATPVLYFLSS